MCVKKMLCFKIFFSIRALLLIMGSIALVLYAYEEKKKTMMRQIATLGARTDKGNRM